MNLPWPFEPLRGERVTLDLLHADDLEALSAIQGDPATARYMLYEARSREQVAAAIARDGAREGLEKAGDYVQPAIRDADGQLVGTLYFTRSHHTSFARVCSAITRSPSPIRMPRAASRSHHRVWERRTASHPISARVAM